MIRGAATLTLVGGTVTALILSGHHPHRTRPASSGSASLAPVVQLPQRHVSRGEVRKPLPVHRTPVKHRQRPHLRLVHDWDAVAQCEASGDWSTNTGNGFYGGLQFTLSTWFAYGGHVLPSQASRAEQIRVAERVLAGHGRGAWPACSRHLESLAGGR